LAHIFAVCLTNDIAEEPPSKSSNKAKSHEHEGFLKSAWHKLTHQHDDLDAEKDQKSKEQDDEEPKKAAGSG
jgi:molecular chaperone DnaJ